MERDFIVGLLPDIFQASAEGKTKPHHVKFEEIPKSVGTAQDERTRSRGFKTQIIKGTEE